MPWRPPSQPILSATFPGLQPRRTTCCASAARPPFVAAPAPRPQAPQVRHPPGLQPRRTSAVQARAALRAPTFVAHPAPAPTSARPPTHPGTLLPAHAWRVHPPLPPQLPGRQRTLHPWCPRCSTAHPQPPMPSCCSLSTQRAGGWRAPEGSTPARSALPPSPRCHPPPWPAPARDVLGQSALLAARRGTPPPAARARGAPSTLRAPRAPQGPPLPRLTGWRAPRIGSKRATRARALAAPSCPTRLQAVPPDSPVWAFAARVAARTLEPSHMQRARPRLHPRRGCCRCMLRPAPLRRDAPAAPTAPVHFTPPPRHFRLRRAGPFHQLRTHAHAHTRCALPLLHRQQAPPPAPRGRRTALRLPLQRAAFVRCNSHLCMREPARSRQGAFQRASPVRGGLRLRGAVRHGAGLRASRLAHA